MRCLFLNESEKEKSGGEERKAQNGEEEATGREGGAQEDGGS